MKEIIKGEPVLFFLKEGEEWCAYGVYVEAFWDKITGKYPGIQGHYREVEVGEGRTPAHTLTFTGWEMRLLLEVRAHACITDSLVAVAL